MLREQDLFEPGQPLYDKQAELFAGRVEVVERGVRAVLEPHSLVMLYGDLGIGKSSAARQIYMTLHQEAFAKRRYPDLVALVADARPRHFVPLWFSCRGYDDIDSVLRALCFSRADDVNDTIAKLFPEFTEKNKRWLIEGGLEATLGPISGAIKARQNSPEIDEHLQSQKNDFLSGVRAEDVFLHLLGKLIEEDASTDVVIFLDDFERLVDKSAFPDFFLRAAKLRIVLVGIAENPAELVERNQSLERHLLDRQIKIERLGADEVRWIFQNAAKVASRVQGQKHLIFTDRFIADVTEISGGLPMIVQYYGRKALRVRKALFRLPKEAVTIDSDVIELIEKDFFDSAKGIEPNLVARIQEGVGNSVARPKVLRAAAERFESWFTLDQVRKIPELSTITKIEDHLSKLVEARVLDRSTETQRYRFWTPTCRMLCRRVPDRKQPS